MKYWNKRGLKGPKAWPFFGNLLDIVLTSRNELELNWYRKYGNFYGYAILTEMSLDLIEFILKPTTRYYLLNEPILVVGELEVIKAILVKDFNVFPTRRGADSSHPIMRKNLATIDGDDWKRVRTITSPTFTSSKMKIMYPLIKKCLTDFMVHLDDLAKTKSDVNIKDIYGNLTLDAIASSVFATNLNSRNELDNLFVKYAREAFRVNPIKILLLIILPKFVFKLIGVNPGNNNYESEDFYVGVVRQILENRKKSEEKFNDYIQLLIDAEKSTTNDNEIDYSESHHVNEGQEELEIEKKMLNVNFNSSNKKLSEDEIIAQAVTFLLAGYETTATALTYATYELALNPEVQDKLFNEVNASLNSNGDIDYDVLHRLPYLDAVISETLRRYPPAIKTNRVALQEYKVGNTGITLYPGQQVDIPTYAIHHDEKYYTNPFKFDPDRFMPQNRHNLVPYTYLPFGICFYVYVWYQFLCFC